MSNKQVQNVYCDFTKSNNAGISKIFSLFQIILQDAVKLSSYTTILFCVFQIDMQKLIGTVDVKSTAVYFHAQMSTPGYSTINTAVPLDLIKFNVGNAYSATGIFVAPTAGNYYFAFSGISDNNDIARVVLQVKSGTGAWTNIGQAYGHRTYQTFSLQSTLQLLKDDQVRLYLTEGKIHDSNLHYYTNFDGWLIQEKELTV
jgi:hypothetical protein